MMLKHTVVQNWFCSKQAMEGADYHKTVTSVLEFELSQSQGNARGYFS